MQFAKRVLASAALALVCALALADTSIRLTSFPTVSVADGKSTVTIAAEVRDQSGKLVQDGTRVVLTSTLGDFREAVVTTVGGVARGILIAGSIAGTARITAKSLTGDSSPSTLEYEFVADRSQLSSAKEYVEIVAPGYMQYTVDSHIIGAAADKSKGTQPVSIRYREITITADDIQLNIPTYELKARKARLKMGGINQYFDELYIKLNTRFGYGTTTSKVKRSDAVVAEGKGIAFVKKQDDGSYKLPDGSERYGLVEIHRAGLTPVSNPQSSLFQFEDISGSPSTVSAKKAIVFPRREVQFQKAEIYVANTKVMSLPLFEVALTGSSSPLVTDQIVSMNNSQLGINFPYYVSLRPGVTQLFRFRTGQVEGRSVSSDRGAFLDYEFNWNKGDDMEGGLSIQGIGRNDWTIGLNQYIRFDDRSSAYAQVLTPNGRSYFGSGGVSRQFDGFSASINASETKTITGIPYTSSVVSAIIEKDPIKVGKLPIRLYPGLTANQSANDLDGQSQSGAGARLRAQSLPLVIDANTSITASFQTAYLRGNNELLGLQYLGSATISKRLSSASSFLLTYDYTHDGFNEFVLGGHRLSLQAYYNRGRLNFSVFGSRSLDLERSSVFADLSYRISNQWRLTSSYTLDKYLGDTYLDYNFGIGYRLGWREVGLIWSEQTRRIGFQLLGTTIY